MSKIEELNSHIQKAKVYVESPEQAPEGAAIKTGPKGGAYYDSGVKVNSTSESVPAKSFKEKFNYKIDEFIADLEKGGVGGKYRSAVAKDVKDAFFNVIDAESPLIKEYDTARHFFDNWKMGEQDGLVEESVFIITGLMDNGLNYDDAIEEFCSSRIIRNTKEYLHSDEFKKIFDSRTIYIKEMRKMLSKTVSGKKVKLYRGCNGGSLKNVDAKEGEKIQLDDKIPVSRWSIDFDVARFFAVDKYDCNQNAKREAKVCILETEIDLKDAYFIDGLMNSSCVLEGEVVINHKSTDVTIKRIL